MLNPEEIISRLEAIEDDLASRGPALEQSAEAWFRSKRDKEHDRAVAFIAAVGTVAERNAIADRDSSHIGRDEEARYESLKAVVRTLEARASIGQTLARVNGRGA